MQHDVQTIKKALYRGWSPRTSSDGNRWSRKGPAWGQCAVSALYVQEKLGGNILRTEYTTPQGDKGSHYFNLLSGNTVYDATAEQFPDDTVFNPPLSERPLTLLHITQDYVKAKGQDDGDVRAYLLSNQSTRERYERLLSNIERFSGPRLI